MARKVNLNDGDFKRFKRNQGALATQTPLSSTAVERGSTRWLDGSTVSIEGLLDVTGNTTISGALNVSGVTTIAGPTGITGALTIQGVTTISGQLDVTGPTKLNGKLDIGGDTTVTGKLDVTGAMATKGTLSVEGVTTLKNHLNVDAGKKITLGGLVLENQGAASAAVQMPGGGLSASTALGMLLQHDSVVIGGQTSLKLESPIISLVGAVKLSSSGTTTQPANVYMDANGYLVKTTWTP